MNRQLKLSLVFFGLTIFLGLLYGSQADKATASHKKMLEVTLEGTNQATIDYYEDKWTSELGQSILYLIGTGICGFISIATLLFGIRRSFKDRASIKYAVEERRHQELLEATRQAQRQPSIPESRHLSMLYTAHPQPMAPTKPTIEQILAEAQRMYKEGNIKMAISVLETTDDPRAQKVLAKLRKMTR